MAVPMAKVLQALGGILAKTISNSLSHDTVKMEHPELLVVLPASIIADNVLPSNTSPTFNDSNRQQLHYECTNAGTFDKLTIPPVNNALNNRGAPLTKASFKALKEDMEHSKQMSVMDPVEKKIHDYNQQPYLQKDIARSFARANEHEGALLHKGLAKGFELRAQVYRYAVAPVESVIRNTSYGNNNNL